MNAFARIEAGEPCRIAEAMDAEGVRLIERLTIGFRVVMKDGREATGFTPRGAISNATEKVAA
ncbi:hypothetical protein CMI47_05045 [Candidatus Pacearchaeota archaeon]|jgi:hypothetical protein|nr:hypothetical protein [Candidatus Pacearchaeota archaeon]|tara:strand:+ start:10057 stop:10245 length:189 start_codon:yes stop_codon:yes gene_type:complete